MHLSMLSLRVRAGGKGASYPANIEGCHLGRDFDILDVPRVANLGAIT